MVDVGAEEQRISAAGQPANQIASFINFGIQSQPREFKIEILDDLLLTSAGAINLQQLKECG